MSFVIFTTHLDFFFGGGGAVGEGGEIAHTFDVPW